MTTSSLTALVAGASGIIGAGIVQQLRQHGWRVLCASRAGTAPDGCEAVKVDLMQPADCERALARHPDITHVFYAAYQPAPSRAAEVAPNIAMLRHLVDAVSRHAPQLQQVVLTTGAKFYGIQWGRSPTPCREDDPRQLPPNFYYDQEDFLREASAGKAWHWTNLIPPFVSGLAVGNPMNLVLGIGVYASVCRELGLPLRFPGTTGCYDALHQIADSQQLGEAAHWAALAPSADNERFNVANGDPSRWRRTWPRIASHFGMPLEEVKTVPLADLMPTQEAVWARLQERHGLQAPALSNIIHWPWLDYMLRMDHDVVLETGKLRRAGFHHDLRTEDVFIQRLSELQTLRILPR